jgi:hypothetical protein
MMKSGLQRVGGTIVCIVKLLQCLLFDNQLFAAVWLLTSLLSVELSGQASVWRLVIHWYELGRERVSIRQLSGAKSAHVPDSGM